MPELTPPAILTNQLSTTTLFQQSQKLQQANSKKFVLISPHNLKRSKEANPSRENCTLTCFLVRVFPVLSLI